MALQFEARKVSLKQDRTGYVLTLSLHPDEIPVELLRDFVGARYGCALVRIQDDESPTQYSNRVQQAGMLCKREDFQDFLGVLGEDDAAAELCERCGISSRSELNGNEDAQMAFDSLVLEFRLGGGNDPF
jgi:hypothetical protein